MIEAIRKNVPEPQFRIEPNNVICRGILQCIIDVMGKQVMALHEEDDDKK